MSQSRKIRRTQARRETVEGLMVSGALKTGNAQNTTMVFAGNTGSGIRRRFKQAEAERKAAELREKKLAALRAALDEGEASPVATGYSLDKALARLRETPR